MNVNNLKFALNNNSKHNELHIPYPGDDNENKN